MLSTTTQFPQRYNKDAQSSSTTHVDVHAGPLEDGDGLVGVPRDEPEDLVAVLVPLDRVELLPLHVVEALQAGAVAQELVTRHREADHPHAVRSWRKINKSEFIERIYVYFHCNERWIFIGKKIHKLNSEVHWQLITIIGHWIALIRACLTGLHKLS